MSENALPPLGNGAFPEPDAKDPVTLEVRIAKLEAKLEDTNELLHLWQNEAYSYRALATAVVNQEIPHSKAKAMLRPNSDLQPLLDLQSKLASEVPLTDRWQRRSDRVY